MKSALQSSANETLSERIYETIDTWYWAPTQSWPVVTSSQPVTPPTRVFIGVSSGTFEDRWVITSSPRWEPPSYDISTWIQEWWPWLRSVTESLDELRRLPENWDSYGAPKIDKAAAIGAIRLLAENNFQGPSPYVIPTSHGGIQLEWQDARGGVEIVVDPNGWFSVLIDTEGAFEERQTRSIRDPFIGTALARAQRP
jgi:hypothetical protein